jgi:hypothetical protein
MCSALMALHSSQARHGTDSLWRTWDIVPGFSILQAEALKARFIFGGLETRFQRLSMQ